MKKLLVLPIISLLLLFSCQEEVIEITAPNETETIVAESKLTEYIGAVSAKDGSIDNIIDKASCLTIDLPVTVIANGNELRIETENDYGKIESIYDEFEEDSDELEIIFPITIILSDFSEIKIESSSELETFVAECKNENEPDDDIECIDFQYPISFSVYNFQFEIINAVQINSNRELYKFIKRVKNGEVFASLNFPVTMVLSDGNTIEVYNNEELQNTIEEAKEACDEDDDNDYGDDDFTKERLDALLITCSWEINQIVNQLSDVSALFKEHVINFKENGKAIILTRNGTILSDGIWRTKVFENRAVIELEFNDQVKFSGLWFVQDIERGKIKLFANNGNKIILKKNCDFIQINKERIENYLKDCFWRVEKIRIAEVDKVQDYIGTLLKFLNDDVVKIRINGEYAYGSWDIKIKESRFVLQIELEGRPELKLEWYVTFSDAGVIELVSNTSKMVLKKYCLDADEDISYVNKILVSGEWKVALFQYASTNITENYGKYILNFKESGRVKAMDLNNEVTNGAWLAYRNEGLYLGIYFGTQEPFNKLNHRWKIAKITPERIELKDFDSDGMVERLLVFEKI